MTEGSMDRRSFVAALGAAGAAWHVSRYAGLRVPTRLGRIGVQLYTVRQAMQQDFEGTIARVAKVGYQEVEFAGYFGRTPQQVKAVLDANGLTAPSTHLQFDQLEKGWEQAIADGHVMGHEYLTMAWIPEERRKTLDDWHRVADLFNKAAATAKQAGMGFAYHNHNYEFMPVEGKLPYDVLLAATDPSIVKMEMDLYWIESKGGDPLAYFAKYPGRFVMVHVKDMDANGGMVDVGAGTLPFKKIFAAHAQAGIQHYFVEHDEPKDAFQSITNSYNYLRKMTF